ncbi:MULTISPECIES: hypothetical protein [Rhizobium]|uniref:hypothetical protein n=1 Tax=Rhizobium phaseoli TaxID=396 RepID=UPI001EF09623|nr:MULTISPECIES: hypothetical protein [Rhizobium]
MLEQVFLWCRDRCIYGPSHKELERLVRSQRQHYFDSWLTGVSARLSATTVALLEGSIAEADGQTGFNTMSGDAGQASLDNNLSMTAKLAFIQKLDLPRNILSTTGKAWHGWNRSSAASPAKRPGRCGGTRRPDKSASMRFIFFPFSDGNIVVEHLLDRHPTSCVGTVGSAT